MKKIEVLGSGCANCIRLEKVAREAMQSLGTLRRWLAQQPDPSAKS